MSESFKAQTVVSFGEADAECEAYIVQIGGEDAIATLLEDPESVFEKPPSVRDAVVAFINHLGGPDGVADKVVRALKGEENELSGIVSKFYKRLGMVQQAALKANPELARNQVKKRISKILEAASS